MRHALVVLAALVVVACSTTGTIAYTPEANPAPGPQGAVSSVTVIDHRDEKPNRLATVLGGFGNPAGVLDTPVPVADVVKAVFTDALQRRQMLSPAGLYQFRVILETLYGQQYMTRKAEVRMSLAVYDRTNQVVYSDAVADRSDAEFRLSLDGTSTRVENLRKDVEALLTRDVDRMLAKPGLTAALGGSGNQRPGT